MARRFRSRGRYRGIRYDKGREPLSPTTARVFAEAFHLARFPEEEREKRIAELAPGQLSLFGKDSKS